MKYHPSLSRPPARQTILDASVHSAIGQTAGDSDIYADALISQIDEIKAQMEHLVEELDGIAALVISLRAQMRTEQKALLPDDVGRRRGKLVR